MEWINNSVTSNFTGYEGFTYRIDYEDGTHYYGKKNFTEEVTRKLGKKELAKITDGRLKKYKTVIKESDWRTYEGSSKENIGRKIKSKTILAVYKTKRALTFEEARLLFNTDALLDEKCLNGNILGKFFRNVFEGEK